MAKVPQKIGLVALSILLVSGLLVIATVAGQTSKVIRIIYTNDTLGYIEPCG
jgi:hypothetical protein